MGDGPLSKKGVTDYLKANRGFLEHHVLEHVDAETLERWYIRRIQREQGNDSSSGKRHSDEKSSKKISISRWKVFVCFVFLNEKMIPIFQNLLITICCVVLLTCRQAPHAGNVDELTGHATTARNNSVGTGLLHSFRCWSRRFRSPSR